MLNKAQQKLSEESRFSVFSKMENLYSHFWALPPSNVLFLPQQMRNFSESVSTEVHEGMDQLLESLGRFLYENVFLGIILV